MRLRTIGLALVAVFAMGAVGVSTASAVNGPHWRGGKFGCTQPGGSTWKFETKATCEAGTPIISTGTWEKTAPITFTNNGNTRLITAADEIICKKAEQTGTGNELIASSPGTDKANIKFTECSVAKPAIGCEVRSKTTGTPFGTIEVSVNTELVYTGTKAQAEKSEPPLGILFKTKAAKNKEFVELEFKGLCAFGPKLVEATGEEHGPGIQGVAGVVCNIVEKAEEENVAHEINCVEKAQQKFFYWEGGVIKEGKAGLKLGTEVAEQVGKGIIKLESGEKYSATGI